MLIKSVVLKCYIVREADKTQFINYELQYTVRDRGERLREANRETNLEYIILLPCLVHIPHSYNTLGLL